MSRLAVHDAARQRTRRAPGDDGADPDFVAGAARCLHVLEAFTPELPTLGNGEIAERSGLAKSTVSRLTATLAALGYLVFEPATQRYRLGMATLSLARSFLGGRGIRALARPHMEALALRFRAPVALAERDGLEMVYLEYCDGQAIVLVPRTIGSRVALPTSAAGRAWLAVAQEPELSVVVQQLRERGGPGTRGKALPTLLATARADLAAFGFARSYGDLQPEVNAVAVPLVSPVDGSRAVFNLAAPAALVDAERFDRELGPALAATVAAVLDTLVAGRPR